MRSRSIVRIALLCGAAAAIAGCATQKPPLYTWGGYTSAVYSQLQGAPEGPEKQIASLEEDIEKARAKNGRLPPGLQAHLGLLYLTTGKTDQAQHAWQAEKAQFPESTTFMDFLLAKFKK